MRTAYPICTEPLPSLRDPSEQEVALREHWFRIRVAIEREGNARSLDRIRGRRRRESMTQRDRRINALHLKLRKVIRVLKEATGDSSVELDSIRNPQ